jgi:hypothetical protein
MKRIVIASFLVGLVGCSGSTDSTGTGGSGAGGTGGSGGSGGTSGSNDAASETGNGGSDIPIGPCTEAGSVCATFKFPTAQDAPTRLIVGFYTMDLPPLGPPDKVGGQYDMPKITPGTELQMKMTGVSLDGDYWLYSALYMPGGGQFQPKKGVDYETSSAAKVTLAKSAPTTLPGTLEFALAK